MDTLDDILEHHGIKGMKWGVRRDRGHEGEAVKVKKLAKLDKKFEKHAKTSHTYVELHNRAAELSNAHDIARINNKPAYKDADFSKDSPLRRRYYNEHQMAFVANVKTAAKEYGTNPSGTRELKITTLPGGDWAFSVVDVKHDAFDELDGTTVKVSYDAKGFITHIGDPSTVAAHLAEVGEDFLAHYGVKGMKWGQHLKAKVEAGKTAVRKDVAERTAHKVTARVKPGQHVQTVGGTKHKAHADAIAARKAEQVAKKNTLDALSNKDLQALVQRMNLEQQYRNLAVKETRYTPAQKIAQHILQNYGGVAISTIGMASPVGGKAATMLIPHATSLAKGGTNKGLSGGSSKGDDKKKDK